MPELITENELMKRLGIKSRSTIYSLMKKRGMPDAVLTHPRRYSEKAISEWINKGGVNQNS
ncbi:AlpA family transcriptional regulator [Orbus hercynius]|uniref:AlpA family transcriptional regulator n=1 Tax=Orbus hercynius TaxID=593135 RepID=A0A495RIB7_9GAMM|nr:helix-turn-helix domain-containing protein [Orbus hercynius]RKS87283.1 AlpA family transcriptional regulator [Orbus hercynius]